MQESIARIIHEFQSRGAESRWGRRAYRRFSAIWENNSVSLGLFRRAARVPCLPRVFVKSATFMNYPG